MLAPIVRPSRGTPAVPLAQRVRSRARSYLITSKIATTRRSLPVSCSCMGHDLVAHAA